LITTFRKVPPGTNGAISVGGTLASVAGGGIVGIVFGLSLILENTRCREGAHAIMLDMITWGIIGGGFGSLASIPYPPSHIFELLFLNDVV